MLNNDERGVVLASTSRDPHDDDEGEEMIRDIHALTPPPSSSSWRNNNGGGGRRETWETGSHRSASLSSELGGASENFTSMSREFNALVIAGSSISNDQSHEGNLGRIGESMTMEETNPLAIVPDTNIHLDPTPPSPIHTTINTITTTTNRVKKEEVESKINAWQTAKIAKINNRFKRDDAVINAWENQELQKASSWMNKVERKLEEKRAKAVEKMQNEIANARRKAEERRASAEAKRGTKVARVVEIANVMRAVGRPPPKRSFF